MVAGLDCQIQFKPEEARAWLRRDWEAVRVKRLGARLTRRGALYHARVGRGATFYVRAVRVT